MAMTKSEVRRAFRTAMAADFAHVPAADDVEHRFSAAFGEKMAALIAKERRGSWQLLSPRRRRALVVAAILAAALLLTACSPTLRQAVTEFVVSVYERFVDLGGTTAHETIETVYVFDPVPEGFEFVSQVQHNAYSANVFYQNKEGTSLVLSQLISDNFRVTVDTEHGETFFIQEESRSILIHSSKALTTASWMHDGYYMELSYFAPMDTDQILSLVASLAPMEQGGLSDGND